MSIFPETKLKVCLISSSRNGLTYQYTKLSITLLYSFTSSTYADALNTALPNPSGSAGLVPSYGIVDMNLTYQVTKVIGI